MISVYFNSNGYYIGGEGVEVARSFSPSVDSSGRPLMEPLQHLYVVLTCALKEIRDGQKGSADIVVYNDSRLIEDMSNETDSPDCVCRELKSIIRRKLLPVMPGTVLFRKKPASYIAEKVQYGKSTMLDVADRRSLMSIAQTMAQSIEENARSDKVAKLDQLKRSWFGERK